MAFDLCFNFFATIIIYKNFPKFYSILLIIIFIFIQALDISVGLKNNVFSNKIVNQREYEDPIWKYIDENFDNLRTTSFITMDLFFLMQVYR